MEAALDAIGDGTELRTDHHWADFALGALTLVSWAERNLARLLCYMRDERRCPAWTPAGGVIGAASHTVDDL